MSSSGHRNLRYDVVIIGSGMSGLTAALTLAQNGLKVAVVESCEHMAPLLRRFKRGNVWCDPGFHYSGGFEKSGALSVIFRYLGMRDKIQSIPMKRNCYDELIIGNKTISLASGFEGVRDSLSSSYPDDKKAIHAYIEKIQKIMDVTPFINFDLTFAEFSKFADMDSSLYDFLDSVQASRELKSLLGQYGQFLYGSPGNEVPFYFHALIMGTFYKSPQTLSMGGDSIVDAFQSRLEAEGVDLFFNTPATALKVDDKRHLKGVIISDKKLLETEYCIFTAHPQLLEGILPEKAVRPAYRSRLRDMENTTSMFTLYLELDEIPERLHHTNVYKLSEGADDAEHKASIAIMSCDPVRYENKRKGLCILISDHSSNFKSIPYGGKKRTDQYRAYKKKMTKKTLEILLDFYPELAGKYRLVAGATPFTYERYTQTPEGTAYGIKQSVKQMKLGPVTSVVGLYLAGQSILMPGVMGAAISGLIGASNIIGMEKLWTEVKKWR